MVAPLSTEAAEAADTAEASNERDAMSSRLETRVEWAQPSDHETLLRFTIDEAVEAEGRASDVSLIDEAVEAALLDPEGKALYLIARSRSDDQLTTSMSSAQTSWRASGHVSTVKEWSDWNNTYYLWITSMYVAPHARGQGVMRALLEAVDDYARELGAPEVRIYVHRENERGARAWRREGFTEAPYWMGHRVVRPR